MWEGCGKGVHFFLKDTGKFSFKVNSVSGFGRPVISEMNTSFIDMMNSGGHCGFYIEEAAGLGSSLRAGM